MKIEEKAKKYDEALEWMRKVYPTLTGAAKEDAEHYFPELKESDDERIRKTIVTIVEQYARVCEKEGDPCEESLINDALAYLEKQKEQKAAVKLVFPKFRVGDIIRNVHDNWDKTTKRISYVDEHGYIFNYRHLGDKAGGGSFGFCFEDYYELVEQKPAEWKPQPESLEALMYAIEGKWEIIKPTSYLSRRLEDLYDGLVNTYNVDETRLAKLPKTAYSAKDIEELRALKDKIDESMELDKPAEWSEEDKETIDLTIAVLKENLPNDYFKTNPANTLNMGAIHTDQLINRLKSLHLQPKQEQKYYWKPTETDVALFNKAVTTNETLTPAERAQLDIIRSKFGYCRATNCNGIVQPEQKPEVKQTGWVARDKGNGLYLYLRHPSRLEAIWIGNFSPLGLSPELFPDLKWEDEPMEVEITIKRK